MKCIFFGAAMLVASSVVILFIATRIHSSSLLLIGKVVFASGLGVSCLPLFAAFAVGCIATAKRIRIRVR